MISMWDKNGKEINLESYGLQGLSLVVEAPSYTIYTETIQGSGGLIDLGKDLNPRNLQVRLLAESFDHADQLVKRGELYDLFNGGESFYVGDDDGKRWLVQSNESWTPERFNQYGSEISIELLSFSGVAESVNRIDRTFTSNFKFNNKGMEINPRNNRDLKYIFRGASNNLTIKNKTTNEVWTYEKTTNASDTIILSGVRPTRNGLSILRDTNKRVLTLAKGINEFEITGATNYEFTISTLFYFL